VEAVACTQWLQ